MSKIYLELFRDEMGRVVDIAPINTGKVIAVEDGYVQVVNNKAVRSFTPNQIIIAVVRE